MTAFLSPRSPESFSCPEGRQQIEFSQWQNLAPCGSGQLVGYWPSTVPTQTGELTSTWKRTPYIQVLSLFLVAPSPHPIPLDIPHRKPWSLRSINCIHNVIWSCILYLIYPFIFVSSCLGAVINMLHNTSTSTVRVNCVIFLDFSLEDINDTHFF